MNTSRTTNISVFSFKMATNEHSGYPLKWFRDQITARNAWECAVCLEIQEDTVQVRDCGHQFCALCIEDILTIDRRCPSCRIKLTDGMIFDDHAARRMIKQLEVNCCNEGCSWTGCLRSLLQDHQNICDCLGRSGFNQPNSNKLEEQVKALMWRVSTLEKKYDADVKTLKKEIATLRARIPMNPLQQTAQLRSPIAEAEPTFTLKIANFTQKLTVAKSDGLGHDCEPFFSSHGYKMKLSVYLDSRPSGYAGHMGVYLHLLKGDFDEFLPWPFTKRHVFIVVDQQDDPSQRQNIEQAIVPGGEEEFERPKQHESRGLGYPNFVKHSTLRTRKYIRDNAVLVNVVVDA